MMKLGTLQFVSVDGHDNLVAKPVRNTIKKFGINNVNVAAIDPELADTAAFCNKYKIGLDISANCVILEAKRSDRVWYVACMVLATDRADVNGVIRRHLDARKISFAAMDQAISLSEMEYGGITPIGLPADWPILVDEKVADATYVVIGSGLRKSKLAVPGKLLSELSNAATISLTKQS